MEKADMKSFGASTFQPKKPVDVVMVLGPNRIVVREVLAKDLEDAYISLEGRLKAAWNSRTKFTEEICPFAGMHVLVRDREWRGILRGVILEVLPNRDCTQFSVFMYDHGRIDIVTDVNIAPMPEQLVTQLTCRAFILHIGGVAPARLSADLNGMISGEPAKLEYTKGGDWSNPALKFVKNWLIEHDDVSVSIFKEFDNATKIGDIFRQEQMVSKPMESLSNALICSNYAVFDKDLAEQQIAHVAIDHKYSGIVDSKAKENRKESSESFPQQFRKQKSEIGMTSHQSYIPLGRIELQNRQIEQKPFQEDKIDVKMEKLSLKPGKIKEIGVLNTGVVHNFGATKTGNSMIGFNCCEIPSARMSINADIPGRTVVRGRDIVRPLESIRKFPFFAPIQKGLENLNIEEGNELQKGVWPHFAKGHDIIIVGGPKSGTTLAYLAPLCADLLMNHNALKTGNGTGPYAAILCSSPSSGKKIELHGETLLTSQNMNQMQCLFANDNNRQIQKRLQKGVEVIITTVDNLLTCQNKRVPCYLFDRLRYLVFDDAHIILKEAKEGVFKILHEYKDYIAKNPMAHVQLLFCGKEWTADVEEMYWKLNDRPTVHIGSPYAAIVYSGVNLTVHHTPNNIANVTLSEILKRESSQKRTVVVCGSASKAECLQLELQNRHGMYAHLAIELSNEKLKYISMLWNEAPDEVAQVLVCTDEVLKYMNVTNATNLIHYDVEDSSSNHQKNKLTVFASRFASMWTHLRNIAEEREESPWHSRGTFGKKLSSHILLSGEEANVDKIIRKLEKVGVIIPPTLVECGAAVAAAKLESAEICSGIKMFGWCNAPADIGCNLRHYFLKKDVENTPSLPRSGQVELRVVQCKNPSLYLCVLLRYFDMNNKKNIVNFYAKFQEYKQILDKHYADKTNRVRLDRFRKGTPCVVCLPDQEGYFRAEIVELMTNTYTNLPNHVKIFCVDIGECFVRIAHEDIFEAPAYIADLPRLSVEMIVNSLQPLKNEKEYNERNKEQARALTENNIYLAKIAFSINNTIWVNPLVEMKKDEDGSLVTDNSVRLNLLHRKTAEFNLDHEKSLIKLCQDADYPMKEYDESGIGVNDISFNNTFFQIHDEYQWAHLHPCSKARPEEHTVSISFVRHPWCMFGNIYKFLDLLDDINKDINAEITELIECTYPNYYNQFKSYYEVGLVVLTLRAEDEQWYRALIMKKGESNGETVFALFYVDYGDSVRNVSARYMFPIHKKFVTRLPFQAIAFNAAHVSPKEHSCDNLHTWPDESIDLLYNKMIPDGIGDEFSVVVLSKDSQSESDSVPCRFYCALMFLKTRNSTRNEGDEIGEYLVNQGCAEYTREGEQTLEKVKNALLGHYNTIFDEKQKLDLDDEDVSDEENEGQMVASAAHSTTPAVPDGFYDDDDDGGFDICIPDAADCLNRFGLNSAVLKDINASISSSNNTTKLVSNSTNEEKSQEPTEKIPPTLQPRCPTEEEGLKHPRTYWSQTDEQIRLTIDLPDLTEYKFTVGENKRFISFRSIKPPNYGFDISLFGSVNSVEEFLTGQSFRIKLTKRLEGVTWPRLPRDTTLKLSWLKEELQFEDGSDDEESKQSKYIPVDYAAMCSDSSSDSDIDEDLEGIDEDDYERVNLNEYRDPQLPL